MTRINEIAQQKNTLASSDLFLIEDGADNYITKKTTGQAIAGLAPVQSVAGKTGNVTVTKDDVGLGSVENTALSTWGGSTNITTLGTISTGTVPIANVSGGAPAANPTFTGVVTVPAGTAAAPSVTITGDTNTGIYSPGADQIALATNGTGRVFVDASGNVGIGTSSPSGRLTLVPTAPASNNIAAAVDWYNGSAGGGVYFTGSAWSYAGVGANEIWHACNSSVSALTFGSDGNVPIKFTSGGSERLRIDSSGNVGIGTSSPGYKLQIAGASSTAVLGLLETGVRSWGIRAGGTATNTFDIADFTAGATRLTIDSSGNVGIGTSGPGAKLDIANAGEALRISGSTTTAYIKSVASGVNQWFIGSGGSSGIQVYTYTADPIAFSTNSTERLRIDSSGRLLVGTSSARTVSAYGIPAVQNESTSHETSSLALISNSNTTASPALVIAKTRGTSNGSFTVVSSGDALGVIQFQGADGTQLLSGARITAEVDGTPGTNDMPGRLVFSTTADGASSPTERMRIKSTGAIRYVTAFTVATLPAGEVGDLARVTDASSPTIGNTVAGGGASAALCWYNGSNWTVIGK